MESAENRLVLVHRNGEKDVKEKCVFDKAAMEKLRNGESSSLPLTSHPGMALGFQKKSYFEWPEWAIMNLALVPLDLAPTCWRYDNGKFLSVTSSYDNNEYVVDVDMSRFEYHNKLWIIRSLDEKAYKTKLDDVYDGTNARAFVLNESDGTISPRDNSDFVLGQLGTSSLNELLMEAVWLNDIDEVKELLQEGADVNVIGNESVCPLRQAIQKGSIEMVTFLLDNGALVKPDIPFLPLIDACYFGHLDIVDLLIQHGADVTEADKLGTTPVAAAALNGKNHVVVSLLDDHGMDADCGNSSAVSFSIQNGHGKCLATLLDRGSSIRKKYNNYETALHQAAAMGVVRGQDLVSILLQKRGNLDMTQIQSDKDRDVLLHCYAANLTERHLSRCIDRAYIKFGAAKALLYCLRLAKLAKKREKLLSRSDVASAENHQRLSKHLQLGGAAILKEKYQDVRTGVFAEVATTKEVVIDQFMKHKACQQALFVAQQMGAKVFFAQPQTREYIDRLWYGEKLYHTVLDSQQLKWESFVNIFVSFSLLVIQFATLLPLTILLPVLPKTSPIRNSKYFFTHPFVRFFYNCLLDLLLAIFFTLVSPESLSSMSVYWKYSLLCAVGGMISMEIREFSRKSFQSYFGDCFKLSDIPGLLFAVSSIICSFFAGDDMNNYNTLYIVSLSCASLYLWLRVLRILTLIPPIGPLVFMLFRMVGDVLKWVTLLIIMVLAFVSSIQKLTIHLKNIISCQDFSFEYFFENTMLGEEILFSCMKEDDFGVLKYFGLAIVYVFFLMGNILLLNMLIAIMTESFASVWDAQAESYLLVRASNCIDMKDEKNLPFPIFYLPFGIYNLFLKLLGTTRWGGAKVGYTFEFDDEKLEEDVDDDDDNDDDGRNEEPRLHDNFFDYIKQYQDDIAGEGRWRLKLNKKIGITDKKVEELTEINKLNLAKMETLETINRELVVNSVRNERTNRDNSAKIDELTALMKELLERDTAELASWNLK